MDKALLEYRMKIAGKTPADLCSGIGISRSALYRKMNGKTEFTLGEIKRIIEILGLETPDEIFFPEKCPKRH